MKKAATTYAMAVLGLVLSAQSLSIPALVGRSPAAIASVLGAPLMAPDAPEGSPLQRALYGVPGGTLDVAFCGGEAFSFQATATAPLPSAPTVAAWVGVPLEGLAADQVSDGLRSWQAPPEGPGPGQPHRLVITASQAGWTGLRADFPSVC